MAGRVSPYLAVPLRAPPCSTVLPNLALSRSPSLSHSTAVPRRPAPPRRASQRLDQPRRASSCLAVPPGASRCLLVPRSASGSPCPAASRCTSPSLAEPLRASGYLNPVHLLRLSLHTVTLPKPPRLAQAFSPPQHLVVPHCALPCLTVPHLVSLCPTRVPRRASPCLAVLPHCASATPYRGPLAPRRTPPCLSAPCRAPPCLAVPHSATRCP